MESRRAFLKKTGIIGAGALAISMSSSAIMSFVVSETEACPLPHYVSGQESININPNAEKLTIKGKLYADKHKSPLKNAKVEIWHADEEGKLDSFYSGVRQVFTTDHKGIYECPTIMPGKLKYQSRNLGKRVFFKITSKQGKVGYTQLYINFNNQVAIDGNHYDKNYVLGTVELPEAKLVNNNMVVNFNFLV